MNFEQKWGKNGIKKKMSFLFNIIIETFFSNSLLIFLITKKRQCLSRVTFA